MAPATANALLVTMALLLLVVLLYRKNSVKTKNRKQRQLPPGPATLPVIGSIHQMLMNKPVFRWIHHLLDEMDTEILCLRLGLVHVITVSSPEMAREVLRTNDAVLASRPASFAAKSLSFGYKNTIMSPVGDQWKKMRRVLASEVLSPSMERRMLGRRVEEADHLVSYVYNLCIKKPLGSIDVRHVARHFCGNIIRRLVFGKRNFFQPTADSAVGPGRCEEAQVDALFTALDYLGAFSISDYFPALVGLDVDGHGEVVNGLMRTFTRLHDPIIEERVEEWRALRDGGKKKEVGDFLDVLVSLEDEEGQPLLTVEEIKAETLEITLATVDNPSNAVEWALAEMVNNPGVMKKAIEEIDEVIGKERLVQESDIGNLNYLKACIREAFRIHPYHPFNPPHVAIVDTTIAGYLVPEGSHVMLSRIGLGRNPKVWDNPLEFQPERHLSNADVVLAEPELRFISFSAGRRGCPAVSLGTSITMMLFARLLQGFTWSKPPCVDKIELQESATSLTLYKPLVLQAKPRLSLHLYEGK
ncbi:tyrosine N-monooxygenase-like [Phragmites australis]|uniref:tyrosine N-monooxygenase-like n=1 Tax=Phragmites australis TaxID=29695 RepID=UPI002D773B5F|nr:tyrosine N-monooxygenase-like [Phragmites australis]